MAKSQKPSAAKPRKPAASKPRKPAAAKPRQPKAGASRNFGLMPSRPTNKSFENYKAWILAVTEAITGQPPRDTRSEAEWRESWQKFWAKPAKK
ncbi:MAG: hypothetical protein HY259_00845 [Chloroflexi bacterium]|nr:hypothetical protein [Chloroflexota bacterium]